MATNAALATLDLVWNLLTPQGHPMAVMGGLSLAAWNHVRATRDVDLLIGIDWNEVNSLLATLVPSGFRPKKSSAIVTVGSHHFLQLLYTPQDEFYDVQFDMLIAESDLQRSALNRRVRREIPGTTRPIDVLHCDDLILFKLVAGRLIDLADVAMLLRENRAVLDLAYLAKWTETLELRRDFAAVWREAFSDVDLPAELS